MAINQDNVLDKLIPTTGTLAVTGNHSVTGSVNSTNTFGFKNRLINGAMVIDQRNAGASVSAPDGTYGVDRFAMYYQTVIGSKGTIQQTPSATETGYATRVNAGFSNYLAFTSNSAYSVASGDAILINQRIEGYNISDLAWGTANAKTVTLSFWVYSSLTGTFGGTLRNAAGTQYYPYSYTISSANTWTQISVTIAGSTTGTWGSTNGIGVYVMFGLGVGSSLQGTANSWSSSAYFSPTGATSVVGTNGATWYVTGVQLEVGTQATSFDYRPYGTELALCQRYFCTSFATYSGVTDGSTSSGQTGLGMVYGANNSFQGVMGYTPVDMRTAPGVILYAPGTNFVNPIQAGKVTYYNGSAWAYPTSTVIGGVDNAHPRQIRVNGTGLSSVLTGYCTLIAGGWSASAEL